MYIYTQVQLSTEDRDRALAPIAIMKEEIVSFRGFIDDDETPSRYRRHAVVTLRSGDEVWVVATFKQLKDLLDPDSDGGTLVESTDPNPPSLDFSL